MVSKKKATTSAAAADTAAVVKLEPRTITPEERREERCSIVLRWIAAEDIIQELLCDVENAVAREVMADCGGARCFDVTLNKVLELLRSDRPMLTAADIAD